MSDTFTPDAATPASTPGVIPSATPAAATPAVTPQSATPTAPVTPSEDRSTWVPPYRLREVTSKHEQALATERARFEAERVTLQRQLQALTGALPPANPELEQVKSQFKEVFPDLAEIGDQAAAIKELIALKDELQAAMKQQWASHNRNAINGLYKAAEVTYGNPLNEDAKYQLGSSFLGYLQSNPEEYETYKVDPSQVTDRFWKAFTDRFISPIQRAQTVATANRIPGAIPQDATSGALPVSTPAKLANQDERLALALANYKANAKTSF